MFDAYTIPATASQLALAAARLEAAVYQADAYFQAKIAPRMIDAAIWSLQFSFRVFVQAVVLTYAAGVKCGRWYRQWFAVYCSAPASVETDVMPDAYALPSVEFTIDAVAIEVAAEIQDLADEIATVAPALLLMPAVEVPSRSDKHAARQADLLISNDILITPAPKATKRTTKAKTTTTARKAPAKRPPAGIAPRKAPTTVRGVAID